jgi:hypothetical protein
LTLSNLVHNLNWEVCLPNTKGPPDPGLNHRIYNVTTKDLRAFSPTRLFYDPGFNVIDATIVKQGGRFVMFLKDETNVPFKVQKNIKIAFAGHIAGPYGPASAPITGEYWCEGPSAIRIGDTWFLYMDRYREHRYGALISRDLVKWEDISSRVRFPEGVKHGTAFSVSEKVLSMLLNPAHN